MKRNITTDDTPLDLVIVGAGIHGAAMAYYAGLTGLKTALIEKDDFCSHTSAQSQKVIHGGLRYLQTLDFKRVVESIRERQRLYKLFPHLIKPLPCLLPLSGWGLKSKEGMSIAFLIYRFLQQLTCNKELSKNKDNIPRILSAQETKNKFPYLQNKKLRGGALWYDGLCLEPERVIISLLKTAANKGVTISNYAEVITIKRIDNETLSITVKDKLTDKEKEIQTRRVALCTGPWLKETYDLDTLPPELENITLISGVNIVIKPLNQEGTSIALDPLQPEQKGLLFVVPWKNYSIGGTIWDNGGDKPYQTGIEQEVARKLNKDIHSRYPSSNKEPDIKYHHFGYVPGEKNKNKHPAQNILKHYLLINREKKKECHILQVVGVKFTTAFDVSLKALKQLFPEKKIDDTLDDSTIPIGSNMGTPQDYLFSQQEKYKNIVQPEHIEFIFKLLGSELPRVIESYLMKYSLENNKKMSYEDILAGLSDFFIKEEMVTSFADLVERRLFPGTFMELTEKELCIVRSTWDKHKIAIKNNKIAKK